MKVFWVMAWEQYYPEGALRNVRGTFHTREEAAVLEAKLLSAKDYDHVEVIDVRHLIGVEQEY
jgi:hypothetical protein